MSGYPYQNLILFGPPGTGKTYLSKTYAIAALRNADPKAFQATTPREEITRAFAQALTDGQIQFVTFHQSFTYEDFIEGIKPDVDSNQTELRYVLRDGIFKRICTQATYALWKALNPATSAHHSAPSLPRKKLTFEELYVEFLAEQVKWLKRRVEVSYPSKQGREVALRSVNIRGNLLLTTGHHGHTYVVTREKLGRLYRRFAHVDDIRKVTEDIEAVIRGGNPSVYWTVFNELKEFEKTLEIAIGIEPDTPEQRAALETEELTYQQTARIADTLDWSAVSPSVLERAERFVLIIDEINRGNVSQIFGELITLIEPDKRGGQPEALSAVLPYSKSPFTVPPNVYLIGTMNTADRSVEALDTALRRRFIFVEMPPDYRLLEETFGRETIPNLARMLESLNRRIAKLLGKEYAIGHAYLLELDSATDTAALKRLFQHRLFPLLQEYFFGDARKLEWVLGEAFFAADTASPEEGFPYDEVHEDRPEYGYADGPRPLLNAEEMSDEAFLQALIRIYRPTR